MQVPAASTVSSPVPSRNLMIATYVVGAAGLTFAFLALGAGNDRAAGRWAAGLVVGGSGLLSFVRHSIFHRSDAIRMGWDLGRRDNFQIEVGLANLAIGAGGILSVLLDGGTAAQAVVVGIYGAYILAAAGVHASELRRGDSEEQAGWGPTAMTAAFGSMLLVCAASIHAA